MTEFLDLKIMGEPDGNSPKDSPFYYLIDFEE